MAAQFISNENPKDGYKNILVHLPCVSIIGFPCFTVNKQDTYKAEKLESNGDGTYALVAFSITGEELKSKYSPYNLEQSQITWEGF